jgi:hypothetical protein
MRQLDNREGSRCCLGGLTPLGQSGGKAVTKVGRLSVGPNSQANSLSGMADRAISPFLNPSLNPFLSLTLNLSQSIVPS